MLQLVQVAPDRLWLLPRHGQDVDVARIALTRDSPLDANEQWLFWLATVVARGGQALEVIADHSFAESGPLSDFALARKSDTVVRRATGQPKKHKLPSRW
jgi:hypothetical protein